MTQSPTCGELPTLTLQGRRVNDDVTVNPVTLGFGDVDCATPSGVQQTITISNYGSQDVPFTVSTAAGSWCSVEPKTGTVPKGKNGSTGTTTLTVTLKPPNGALGNRQESLTIDVAGPQAKQTTVSVIARSVGAVLAIKPLTLSDFAPPKGKSFSVTNTGNAFTYVHHESSVPSFSLSSKDTALFPGLATNVTVKYVGGPGAAGSATITTTQRETPPVSFFPKSASLCSPAPVVNVKRN
jgi:hypothetical protein